MAVAQVRRFVGKWAPALLGGGGYLVAFAVAMVTWSWVDAQRSAAARAQFGKTTAQDLAFLAAEPLLREDRIRLSLVAGRLVERAEIRRIVFHTAQGRLFVVVGTGTPGDAPPYVESVAVDEGLVGDVRVTLNADAFGLPVPRLLAETWLHWLTGLALVAAVCQGGWLLAARPRRSRACNATEQHVAPTQTVGDGSAADNASYVLVVNLFGHAGTTPEGREHALGQATAIAEQVASGRAGAVSELPAVGLLVVFDAAGEDRAFEVAGAAVELRQRLAALRAEQTASDDVPADAAWPSFRYCLDATALPQRTVAQAPDTAQMHAVRLLSSLAPDGELILCERAYAALAAPDRLVIEGFHNPAVTALTTDAVPVGIVRGLAKAPR